MNTGREVRAVNSSYCAYPLHDSLREAMKRVGEDKGVLDNRNFIATLDYAFLKYGTVNTGIAFVFGANVPEDFWGCVGSIRVECYHFTAGITFN